MRFPFITKSKVEEWLRRQAEHNLREMDFFREEMRKEREALELDFREDLSVLKSVSVMKDFVAIETTHRYDNHEQERIEAKNKGYTFSMTTSRGVEYWVREENGRKD